MPRRTGFSGPARSFVDQALTQITRQSRWPSTWRGVGLLLTGDLEPPAQRVVAASEQLSGIDVVKVPHHGSRNQATGFVSWVGKPSIAVISVGARNSYGHPAAQTVASWVEIGAQVARTDVGGDIAIVAEGHGGARAVSRDG